MAGPREFIDVGEASSILMSERLSPVRLKVNGKSPYTTQIHIFLAQSSSYHNVKTISWLRS